MPCALVPTKACSNFLLGSQYDAVNAQEKPDREPGAPHAAEVACYHVFQCDAAPLVPASHHACAA